MSDAAVITFGLRPALVSISVLTCVIYPSVALCLNTGVCVQVVACRSAVSGRVRVYLVQQSDAEIAWRRLLSPHVSISYCHAVVQTITVASWLA